MQLSDNAKKLAASITGISFAIAMAIQTFVFGKSDMQNLSEQMTQVTKRLELLEQRLNHDQ